ncbi:MAG: hypothetical protein Q8P18_18425 [Pseudomonadota bacterium]|nr:hypothetical protein [Pseudomonadota bacterium]
MVPLRNCNTCVNEYTDPAHAPHKLCRLCWQDRPGKEEVMAWIHTPGTIIDYRGSCDRKADNCPGWEKR